ncbi:glycosyltransferase [Sphingobacterium sp. SRCM116780]|uniref:glycosyltransferase n=1 Tax=Sphingobacterium sp. SRCM116780 TaxID=2907623 RepID=UPI001F3A7854|nr:glycosyltransferase [Sphingobacterium sp. SRCM116780]UIR55223.1 glycosyltransferase [Sphingobacterium sp. SRCM116780]
MIIIQQYAFYYPFIAFGMLALLLLFQLYYLLFVYGKLSRYAILSFQDQDEFDPISVIICAHNEQNNLQQFLTSILEQDYPQFEVIVVNDYSTDDTKWVLQEFQTRYPQLKIVDIKEHIRLKHGKKFAVTMGIKSASYEQLVLTDADCIPQSNNWLKEIAGALCQPNTEIVIGYSPYFKQKGFLNKLIRFETTHTAMSYLAYALKKDAYMAVGRNMAYKKSLFFKNKGFASHMHVKSGDDDLFVNENTTRDNTVVCIHPDSIVYSEPKKTWKSYYKQKARHSGASVLYKKKHQRMLGMQLITSFLFYCGIILTALFFPGYWYVPLAAYAIRLLVQLLVFRSIYKKLAVSDLIWWLPLLDIIYYFYICTNGLFNRKKKSVSWK